MHDDPLIRALVRSHGSCSQSCRRWPCLRPAGPAVTLNAVRRRILRSVLTLGYVVSALLLSCLAARQGHGQTAAQDSINRETLTEQEKINAVLALWPGGQTPETWGWKGRLVVGEYVTGPFCIMCQIHEATFDALRMKYPETAFIALAYQMDSHVPLGDPVDSSVLKYQGWYGSVEMNSGVFAGRKIAEKEDEILDGFNIADGTGMEDIQGKEWPQQATTLYYPTKVIDTELRRPPEAFFHLQSTVQGGRVLTRVQVDSVTGQHPKVYLRLLLVEDTVLLIGDGIDWKVKAPHPYHPQPMRQLHFQVVRAVARTKSVIWGLPLQVPGTVQYTFDVAAIQRRHLRYYRRGSQAFWDMYPDGSTFVGFVHKKKDGDGWKGFFDCFPDERDWRMNPTRLHVVAYVQDAQTGEILQAATVPVNDWKNGKRLVLP